MFNLLTGLQNTIKLNSTTALCIVVGYNIQQSCQTAKYRSITHKSPICNPNLKLHILTLTLNMLHVKHSKILKYETQHNFWICGKRKPCMLVAIYSIRSQHRHAGRQCRMRQIFFLKRILHEPMPTNAMRKIFWVHADIAPHHCVTNTALEISVG